ncbi:MAG: beta-ketothiolase BktB [Roseinatronobacter sp.]|nr:beta-ketothiolase BktB [Roseinatronobacter sp.]
MQDVVLVSAVRTAIGSFGGALAGLSPTELGIATATEAMARAGLGGAEIDQVFYGHVIPTEPRDMYLARTIALGAGVAQSAPALTLNRLCGSGMQAILSGIQTLRLAEAEVVLAGGAESMSRAAYLMPAARWGQKMGDVQAIDMMTAVLTDPFGHGHMGVTAENIAQRHEISREVQDSFAAESHFRAAKAITEGRFAGQIVPITLTTRKGERVFETDEHVRPGTRSEDLAKLRPAFQKDGSVTAGNASGLNDGAAAVILMGADSAKARGIRPMARILSYGLAGVDPAYMGMGPVPAMQIALERAGLQAGQLDVIESNEAFAAQACAVMHALGLDPAKVNPNGGAVALGHPVGASGAIITTKLVHELQRIGGRYGAATMCIGGGQGIAIILENMG